MVFLHVEKFRIAGLAEVGHYGCHSRVIFRYQLLQGFNQGILHPPYLHVVFL